MSEQSSAFSKLSEKEVQFLSTIAVSVVTTTISVVNKLAVADYPHSSMLSLVQTTFIAVGMLILIACGRNVGQISWKKASMFFPTALATSANFVTNFKALETLNVSTLAVMHNVNLILVCIFDAVFFGRQFKTQTLLSLLVIVIGAVMYCYGEIQVSLVGYMWVFLHLIAHESQSLYTKYVTYVHNFTAYEMSLYNSLWSFPILLIPILLSDDLSASIDDLFTPKAFWVVVSAFCAMLLSNLRFFTLKNLSVTAYAALNIVNKVPASIVGVFLFHQQVTLIQIIGYVIAFFGSWLYALYGTSDVFDESRALIHKKPILPAPPLAAEK